MSDSLQPHGLQPTRFLCPWDFPGKNTGVGCHFLLRGIFLAQGLTPGLLHADRVTMWVTREVRNKREPGINSLTNSMALHEFPTQTGYVGILSCDLHSPMMRSCWFFRVFTESEQWTLWCTTDSSFCPQQGGPCAITARSVGSWRYTAKFLFRNCSQFKVTSPLWETCIHWLVHVGLQGPVSYLNLGGPPLPMRSPEGLSEASQLSFFPYSSSPGSVVCKSVAHDLLPGIEVCS